LAGSAARPFVLGDVFPFYVNNRALGLAGSAGRLFVFKGGVFVHTRREMGRPSTEPNLHLL
jgi:hypothetical protein